jgi:hypothetical protein
LQTKTIDLVSGEAVYHGKLLDCNSERRQGKTLSEHVFGERFDKCGKNGKYWRSK